MRRHGIRKPRRQHPSTLFPESDVARGFVARIHEMVGPRLTYTPVAQVGSGHNAWRIDGPLGRGLLVESDDGAQPGGTFRTRSIFIGHRGEDRKGTMESDLAPSPPRIVCSRPRPPPWQVDRGTAPLSLRALSLRHAGGQVRRLDWSSPRGRRGPQAHRVPL